MFARKFARNVLPALLALSAALALPPAALGQTVVLQPEDGKDTELRDGFALPLGNGLHIISNAGGGPRSVGLVEFDLSTLPPGTPITSATLSIFQQTNRCLGCRYDVFRVTSPWDEATATMATAPTFDPAAFASFTIGDNLGGFGIYRDWDVTALVNGWLNGTYANYGFWIEEIPIGGEGNAFFASSDWDVAFNQDTDPRLTVEYAAVPEPDTLALLAGVGALVGWAGRRRRTYAV